MTIKTKFGEGDTIFFIHNAKVIRTTVRGLKIERKFNFKEKDFETEIIYLCNNEVDEQNNVNIKVSEEIAFPTKEALLKSL